MESKIFYVSIVVAFILLPAVSLLAYQNGAADGYCGDPTTNLTCNRNACHNTFPTNSGGGYLTINNLPPTYTLGSTYGLQIMLQDDGLVRWGFQLTALDPSNLMAGSFTITDPTNTWLSNNPGTAPDYVNHTNAGTYAGTPNGPVYWNVDWTAPAAAAGTIRFYLAGCTSNNDIRRTDDYIYTYTVNMIQENRDLSVLSISSPPDSICVDSLYSVQATVMNEGDLAQSFRVVATISPSGYADTVQTSLSPGETTQVTFSSWQCPGTPNTYTCTVTAVLAGDVDPSDNVLSKQMDSYYCAIHDMAVVSIVVPRDSICTNSSCSPTARLVNLGNVRENANVTCAITPSGYLDTATVMSVDPAETVSAVFSNWTVPPTPDTYAVVVRSLLSKDMNTSNDTLSKQSASHFCLVHDVGILLLLSPPSEVCTESTYSPSVMVVNYGNTLEGFVVRLSILPGYSDTFFVAFLPPGDTAVAPFSDWTVPAVPDTFQLTASLRIPADADTSNDTLKGSVVADSCYMKDLAVLNIIEPDWWVCADSFCPVRARVANYGEKQETFSVGFLIMPFYEDTSVVTGLMPGDSSEVSFRLWRAPSFPDSLILQCSILDASDLNPFNDVVQDSTYVYRCPGVAESWNMRGAPNATGILSASPSPARRSLELLYAVRNSCDGVIEILDPSGRVVRSLHSGRFDSGFGRIVWDLRSDAGDAVVTGVYFARMLAGKESSLKKLVVVR